ALSVSDRNLARTRLVEEADQPLRTRPGLAIFAELGDGHADAGAGTEWAAQAAGAVPPGLARPAHRHGADEQGLAAAGAKVQELVAALGLHVGETDLQLPVVVPNRAAGCGGREPQAGSLVRKASIRDQSVDRLVHAVRGLLV